VQNTHYAVALQRGRLAAERTPEVLDAVQAIVRPIVECNRAQIDNGRTYLREMVFGDPNEPHHHAALTLAGGTEAAIADVFQREGRSTSDAAANLARVVSAIMFLNMAASTNLSRSIEDLLQDIRNQVAAILPA
jgi:TetR/AcrR family transcriptional regulator